MSFMSLKFLESLEIFVNANESGKNLNFYKIKIYVNI